MKKSIKITSIILVSIVIVASLSIFVSANDNSRIYVYPEDVDEFHPSKAVYQDITRYASNYNYCKITFLVWDNYIIYEDGSVSGDLFAIGWSYDSAAYDNYTGLDNYSLTISSSLNETIRSQLTNQDVLNFRIYKTNTNIYYNNDAHYILSSSYAFIEGKEVTLTNFREEPYYVTTYYGGNDYAPYYYMQDTPYVSSGSGSGSGYDGSAFEYIISQFKMLLEPLYNIIGETAVNCIVFLILSSIVYLLLIRNLFRLIGSTKCIQVSDIIYIALCICIIISTLGINLIGVIEHV